MKTRKTHRGAMLVVGALIVWALAFDVARLAWRWAQAHPLQAASWLLGGVVVVIVFVTLLSLSLED